MATKYRPVVEDQYFNPIMPIDDYIELDMTDTINAPGVTNLQLPIPYLDNPFDLYRTDLFLAIYESTDGSPWQLHRQTKWPVEDTLPKFDSGSYYLNLQATDALGMALGRRCIPYYAASSQTGYAGQSQSNFAGTYADNMIKDVARYNIGPQATDYTQAAGIITVRQFPPALFQIDPNTSQGAVVGDKAMSWRNDLTGPMQELAAASYQAGIYLAFDVIMDGGKLTFRTYPNQRGRDHSLTSGKPVILTPGNGLSQAELLYAHSTEANMIYCGGQNEGNARVIATAGDTTRQKQSIWNYREQFQDARNGGGSQSSVQAEANTALNLGLPVLQLQGVFAESLLMRYGMAGEVFFGDTVGVNFNGKYQFNARIEQANVKAKAGQPATPNINIRGI